MEFAIWDLHAKIAVPVLINYYYYGIKFLINFYNYINFYKQKQIVLDTVFGINRGSWISKLSRQYQLLCCSWCECWSIVCTIYPKYPKKPRYSIQILTIYWDKWNCVALLYGWNQWKVLFLVVLLLLLHNIMRIQELFFDTWVTLNQGILHKSVFCWVFKHINEITGMKRCSVIGS